MKKAIVSLLVLAALSVTILIATNFCSPEIVLAEEARVDGMYQSDETIREQKVADAIVDLQPWYRNKLRKARRLAGIIMDASVVHNVDPFIALSMAFCESSLLPSVGHGRKNGDDNEEGYFQIMPNSYPRRVCAKGRDMTQPTANADTAMCYLSHVRDFCGSNDPWVYVAAYGLSYCPTSDDARRMRAPQRRRQTFCSIVGTDECNESWPQ